MTLVHRSEGDLGHISDHNEIADHVNNISGKHPASSIVNTPAGSVGATDLQGAVNELDGDVTGHVAASTSVHGIVDTSLLMTTAMRLHPTALKTANHSALVGEFVPVSTAGGAVTVTLPTTPANGTPFGTKLCTAGNTLTVARGGTALIGKPTTGVTSVPLNGVDQTLFMVYESSADVWYEVTPVKNALAPGTNITLDAPSNGSVNINVEPVIADIWTPKFIRLGSDSTIVTSSTATISSGLLIALGTNAVYKFEAIVYVDSTVAAQFRFNFTVPASATGDFTARLDEHTSYTGGATVNAVRPNFYQAIGGSDVIVGSAASGTVLAHAITGHVVTVGTSGNLTLNFAQGVSTGVNTFVKAGSSLEVRRMS